MEGDRIRGEYCFVLYLLTHKLLTPTQMQAHHLRFLYHEDNWLIRHLQINHLPNMNNMQDDSDIEVHRRYLAKETPTIKTPSPTRGPISQRMSKVC